MGACWCRRSRREARAIVHAARHDSDGFIAGELKRRRAISYPPFSNLVRIVLLSRRVGGGACGRPRAARATVSAARAICDASVLGPAALFRLRGRERYVLVVKSAERRCAVRDSRRGGASVGRVAAHAGVSISVDVDPQ